MDNQIIQRLQQEELRTLGSNQLVFKLSNLRQENCDVSITQKLFLSASYSELRTEPCYPMGSNLTEFEQELRTYTNSEQQNENSLSNEKLDELLLQDPYFFFNHKKCKLRAYESSYYQHCSTCRGSGKVEFTEHKRRETREYDNTLRVEQYTEVTTRTCNSCDGRGGHITECEITITASKRDSFSSKNQFPWLAQYLATLSKNQEDYCELVEQTHWQTQTYNKHFEPNEGYTVSSIGTIQVTECQAAFNKSDPKLISFIGPNMLIESLNGLFDILVCQILDSELTSNSKEAQKLFTSQYGDGIAQAYKKAIKSGGSRYIQTCAISNNVAEKLRVCFIDFAKSFKNSKSQQVNIFSFSLKVLIWFSFFAGFFIGMEILARFLRNSPINFQIFGIELFVQHFDYYFSEFRQIGIELAVKCALYGAPVSFIFMKLFSSPKTKGTIKYLRWWFVTTTILYIVSVQATRPVVHNIWSGLSLTHWELSINFAINLLFIAFLIAFMRTRRKLHNNLGSELQKLEIPALNKYLGFKSMI